MSNRAAGRKAKAVGQQFENLIERSCMHYRRKEIAHIHKTPEPFRMLRRQGSHVVGFYEKKAQPDFSGTLADGQSIVMEAKHTSSTNIRFDSISANQEKEMNIHNELSAICLVLVTFKFDKFYSIPWKDWRQLKKTINKKSVNQKDLKEYEVKLNKGVLAFLER